MSNSIQIHYANMAFMVPFLRNYLRKNQFSETQVGIQNLLEVLRNLRIQDPPQNIHDRDFQFFERVIREYKELHSPNIILQKRRHWSLSFVIIAFCWIISWKHHCPCLRPRLRLEGVSFKCWKYESVLLDLHANISAQMELKD